LQTKEGKLETISVSASFPAAPLIRVGDEIKLTTIKRNPDRDWEDHRLSLEHPVGVTANERPRRADPTDEKKEVC
jgi:hypothetical protein